MQGWATGLILPQAEKNLCPVYSLATQFAVPPAKPVCIGYIWVLHMRKTILILLISLSLAGSLWSQTRLIDSLKRNVYRAADDDARLPALLSLCEESRNVHRDTLEFYVLWARNLAAQLGNRRERILAELAYANMHFRWGWIDSALSVVEPVFRNTSAEDATVRDLHFKAARQKALYYGGQLKYSEALQVLYRLISDAERFSDTVHVAANMNTIASIALQRSAPRTALMWLRRAYQFTSANPLHEPIRAAIFTNMADAYTQTGRLDSAFYFIRQGVDLFSREQNLSNLAHALQRQSSIYIKMKNLDSAEAVLKQMIEVRRQTNDGSMWLDDNLSLIDFYLETGQAAKAIAFCREALQRGNVQDSTKGKGKVFSNNVNLRLSYYEALARCYKSIGDDRMYQETLERIISAKDSFYLANSAEAIAEMQTKYEVQKKENTIIQQQLSLAKKNNLFYLTVAAAGFVAAITVLAFVSYRKREKLKMQLLLDREKAEAEENERKRIAADLHDNLGAYAASIASNLDFLVTEGRDSRDMPALHELRNNSQAIVAQLSDTIWALNKEKMTLTSISDRVKIFLKRLRPSYPHVDMTLTENIANDIPFPPTQAYHLFRIIQEAVVNSLKHSRGSRVTILINGSSTWSIVVRDNGIGLPQSGSATGGNGLGNMQRRAFAAGCRISWINREPGGLDVTISP